MNSKHSISYCEYVEAYWVVKKLFEANCPFSHTANVRMGFLQFFAHVAQTVWQTHSCGIFSFIFVQSKKFVCRVDVMVLVDVVFRHG